MRPLVLALSLLGSLAVLPGPDAFAEASRSVTLPVPGGGEGLKKEVRVLVDGPDLKLVTIVLREGTALPAHSAEVPVTIQALSGEGALVAAGETSTLDARHMVELAAGVEHSITPQGDANLVLLVHYLKSSRNAVKNAKNGDKPGKKKGGCKLPKDILRKP